MFVSWSSVVGLPASGFIFMLAGLASPLQFRHLGQPSAMSGLLRKTREQEPLHQLPGHGIPDDPAPKANYVHVIVLDALVGGKRFVDETGADPDHLVCRDRSPHPAPAYCNTSFDYTGGDGAGQRQHKVRVVVIRLALAVSEVDHLMPGLAEAPDQIFAEIKPPVIAGNPNLHSNRESTSASDVRSLEGHS